MTRQLLQVLCFLLIVPSFLHAQSSFPEKCLGTWEGMLHIYSRGQLKDSVPVTLEVERTADPATFQWVTTYHSEEHPMVKPYQLKLQKPGSNTYVMIEEDDVSLFMYAFDNKLYSLFETENTILSNTYELRDNTLLFEVNSASQQATGSVVNSYQIDYLQKAAFTRKKP
ncbi:hypothetical protein [Robertkochia flava]|uniref:hypothetical protein n=1 Tax=Robertkochia flava TaxID=3447986 RepID=UPI001CCD93FE|nr:hypothetical protein [Robertkochia marina]